MRITGQDMAEPEQLGETSTDERVELGVCPVVHICLRPVVARSPSEDVSRMRKVVNNPPGSEDS